MNLKYEDRYKTLGLNIQFYRKMRNMNQEQLAAMVDMDRSHISGIEQGRKAPSVDLLYQIADALNVTESQLFDRRDC